MQDESDVHDKPFLAAMVSMKEDEWKCRSSDDIVQHSVDRVQGKSKEA
jgi:hypothetical protein